MKLHLRSVFERTIAHIKNWNILATGYRGGLGELVAIANGFCHGNLDGLRWITTSLMENERTLSAGLRREAYRLVTSLNVALADQR